MSDYSFSGNEKAECYSCGRKMVYLAKHWKGEKYDCGFPEPSKYEKDLLTGILMGDASLGTNNSYPYIQMDLTNEEFLSWLSNELERFGSKYHQISTAEEIAERSRKNGWNENCRVENCKDVFRFSTSIHPYLEDFEKWYCDSSKKFPSDIKINSTIAKMWYCCDGDYKTGTTDMHKPISRITSRNESERSCFLLSLFEEHGFNPYWENQSDKVCFTVKETPEFLSWMGSPPPGFEYKWGK